MTWEIKFSRKARKQANELKTAIESTLLLLIEDLSCNGPTATDWANYGKLHGRKNEDKRHCHLLKGKPTYVCCWEVKDKKIKIIEVYYVGTHENAPY